MDYLCTKFDDFNFSRFGYIVRTDRINIVDVLTARQLGQWKPGFTPIFLFHARLKRFRFSGPGPPLATPLHGALQMFMMMKTMMMMMMWMTVYM